MDLFDVASLVAAPAPRLRLRKGTVVSVQGSTITVTIAGSAVEVAGVKCLSSLCPVPGAGVWLATDGLDLFALGTIAPVGPAYCAVRRPTDQSIADTTDTPVNFTASATVEKDTHGMFASGSPAQLTVRVPGLYMLSATVWWPANSSGLRAAWFTLAGGQYGRDVRPGQNTGTNIISIACLVHAAAGDAVTLTVRQSSGGSLSCSAGSNAPRLAAAWLRGPA